MENKIKRYTYIVITIIAIGFGYYTAFYSLIISLALFRMDLVYINGSNSLPNYNMTTFLAIITLVLYLTMFNLTTLVAASWIGSIKKVKNK